MGNILLNGINALVQNGLVQILIFALIFAVVFGILQNVKIFGDDGTETKKYNAIIAMVFGLLAILPNLISPNSKYDIVPIVERALPQTMLVLVALLGVLILLGLFGWNMDDFSSTYSWLKPIVAIVLIVIVFWIFVAASPIGWRLPYWLDRDIMAVVIALAVFGVIVGYIMSDTTD